MNIQQRSTYQPNQISSEVTAYDIKAPRKGTRKITYGDLEKHFHQPAFMAEIYFDLNTENFRKICKENGIIRWPYHGKKTLTPSAQSWKIERNDSKMKSTSENMKQIERIAIRELVKQNPIQNTIVIPVGSNDNDIILLAPIDTANLAKLESQRTAIPQSNRKQ